jgi:hypothetical protein
MCVLVQVQSNVDVVLLMMHFIHSSLSVAGTPATSV